MTRTQPNRQLILFVLLLLYWAIGFYPYQLPPYHNGAVHTADQIQRFDVPGIALSREPPAWLPIAIASSSFRVTLEVRAAYAQKSRWARIFTISGNSHRSNLSIGQDGSDLIVQMRNPGTNLEGRPGYIIEEIFAQPGWHRIELNVLPSLLTVTADGREVLRHVLPPEPLSNWSSGYRLALGNAPGFRRPWLGKLRKAIVLVADESYNYTLPDALETPAYYDPPLANRYIQWTPFSDLSDGSSAVVDKVMNLFGFIPFGVVLAMIICLPRSVWSLAVMCCAVSLSIEVGQLILVSRTPSIDDLLFNSLGGAAGAWLGLRARPNVISED